MEGDMHAKVSDDNVAVRVLGAVENVAGSEEWVKGEGWEREKRTWGLGGRCRDSDRVVLGKLALCEDAVKELSAGGEFEGEVIFCAQLEALVKLDLD